MRKKTKILLHRSYVTAVEESSNILEIIENLYNLLHESSGIPSEDMGDFENFLRGLYTSKMIRRQTFQLTNLTTDMVSVIMYIIVWLNSTKQMHLQADITGRRKALETELGKLWEKPFLHDRFGIRTIISTPGTTEENNAIIIEVSSYIIGILTRKHRKMYNEFLSWIHTVNIDKLSIFKIEYILNLPLTSDPDLYKDYVSNPKDSTYQSLHFVLDLESFSPILPGSEFELQFRTHAMHDNAEKGPASEYSKKRRPETQGIFCVDDFSQIHIDGFTSYDSKEHDTDGIHFPKQFIARKVSPTLVYL